MYDVIIVGGGMAGCSVAMYTAYAELSTLVLDTGKSQIKQVSEVRNFPGIEKISGDQLWETMKQQSISFGSDWVEDQGTDIEKTSQGYKVTTASGQAYDTKYLVLATNVNVKILETFGFEIEVNPKVPSGKIKQVVGVAWDGVTAHENLYITGLLAGLPTQSVVASGQGTAVGVDIVSKEKGKPFVWHDK